MPTLATVANPLGLAEWGSEDGVQGFLLSVLQIGLQPAGPRKRIEGDVASINQISGIRLGAVHSEALCVSKRLC